METTAPCSAKIKKKDAPLARRHLYMSFRPWTLVGLLVTTENAMDGL